VKAYDPPEVFAVFTGEDQTKPFGDDFCCIEDQNGDGCDELLVNNFPYTAWGDNNGAVNQVMYYWGCWDMSAVDVVFSTNIDYHGLGREVVFHGNVIPDQPPIFTIGTTLGRRDQAIGSLYMFEAGENIDNEVDLILTKRDNEDYHGIYTNFGRKNQPADLNGDGYHDIIVKEFIRSQNTHLLVYFGGEDFDTISDWGVTNPPWIGVLDMISGFDINGDGYDDIFTETYLESGATHYYVFLGGEPMDTTSSFDFGTGGFECEDGPAGIGGNLTMLQELMVTVMMTGEQVSQIPQDLNMMITVDILFSLAVRNLILNLTSNSKECIMAGCIVMQNRCQVEILTVMVLETSLQADQTER
jgi:hypothetical protein